MPAPREVGAETTVTPGSATRHTIDGLANGTTYTVRVIAIRTGATDGQPSAEVTGNAEGARTCPGIASGRRDRTRAAPARHGRTRAARPREQLSPDRRRAPCTTYTRAVGAHVSG